MPASEHGGGGVSTTACERALEHEVGERIHRFTINQVTSVAEQSLTAVKLTHDSTGVIYLHLDREDTNTFFSMHFYLTPIDSTGSTHSGAFSPLWLSEVPM